MCMLVSCLQSWMTATYLGSSTKRDYELKETFIKVILDAHRGQTETNETEVSRSSTTKPTAFAIYRKTKSDIASARELLRHYERASQQIASSKGIPMMESGWAKGSHTLQRILNKQGENVKLEVHQILNEAPRSTKEQVEGNMSKLDTEIWDRFAVSEAKEENVKASDRNQGKTWAVVAKNAKRGVRRAVKDLPED